MQVSKIVVFPPSGCFIPEECRGKDGNYSILVKQPLTVRILDDQKNTYKNLVSSFTETVTQVVSEKDQLLMSYIHNDKTGNQTRVRGYYQSDGIKLIDGYVTIGTTNETLSNCNVEYSFQIIGINQLWKGKTKDCLLCELDVEEENFVWTKENILERMQNSYPYGKNDKSSFYPLLANFGQYTKQGNPYISQYRADQNSNVCVEVADIRYVHYFYPLIMKAFCKLGYTVDSRILSSEWFRRQAGYLLSENFVHNSIIEYSHLFSAKVDLTNYSGSLLIGSSDTEPIIIPINDDTGQDCFDPDNVFDTSKFSYINDTGSNLQLCFCYKGTWRIPQFSGNGSGISAGRIQLIGILEPIDLSQPPFQVVVSEIDFVEESCFDIVVPDGYSFKMGYLINSLVSPNAIMELTSFRLNIERKSAVYLEGDEVNTNKGIDSGCTLDDLLIDLSIAMGLKFNTSESNGVISIEPDTSVYEIYETSSCKIVELVGRTKTPNQKDSNIEITNLIDICKPISKKYTSSSLPIRCIWKFKDSEDQYPKYQDEDLSKEIANQNGTSNEKKYELETFEPTINDYDLTISIGATEENDVSRIWLPYMWDNLPEEGRVVAERSTDVGKRWISVLGWSQQYESENHSAARWKFVDEEFDFIPTIGQWFEGLYSVKTGDTTQTEVKPQPLNNVFEQETVNNDMAITFYRSILESENNNPVHEFPVDLSNLMFHCFRSGILAKISSDKGALSKFNGYYKISGITKKTNSSECSIIEAQLYSQPTSCLKIETTVNDVDCDCTSQIVCSECIAKIDPPCPTFNWTWYKVTQSDDGSNQPNDTVGQVEQGYEVIGTGSENIPLLTDESYWYAAIGKSAFCEDVEVLIWYWHHVPKIIELDEEDVIDLD